MFKKIFSIFLVFVLCFSIVFQCSLTSHAVFGIDDALLVGAICLDLAACGVTIYSVSQFVQSDTFADFTHQLGADIDQQISVIKRNGQLFFATTKLGWYMVTNWVKNHFSGATEDKTITYEAEVSASPEFLILSDGTTVPYATFMEFPFFIYRGGTSGNIFAYYCTGNAEDCGITVATRLLTMYAVGNKKWGRFDLVSGEWVDRGLTNMHTGATVMGQAGSQYVFQYDYNTNPASQAFFLFRTIEIWANQQGGTNPNYGAPDVVEDGTSTQSASVEMHSDGTKYPGAIDAPTETIKEGEKVLVKVPESMVVDNGNGDLTISTDAQVVGQAIADTTASDVEPRILTDTAVEGVDTVVGDVIADTPAGELSGNAQADIETANKFRLPKSFLEGFPFSIPYSVFVGIKSFVAEGHAPVFNIPFSIDRLGISENVSIDLTQWNPVARLCRALLSVVWVAGLAMACSKFLKR